MARLVVKFGGSSLSTTAKINKVAEKIAKINDKFDEVVVVVSAMGKTTDKLITQAKSVNLKQGESLIKNEISDRLLNLGEIKSACLLGLALENLGRKVEVLNGNDAGIKTQGNYGNSFIKKIEVAPILKAFKAKSIAVVAGFCGENDKGKITTLGRGGSDTTAVALAAALGCKCKIFTDVSHIFTVDPRLIKNSKTIAKLNHDDALQFCSVGAKVLDVRCVEIAKKFGTEIELAASKSNSKLVPNGASENNNSTIVSSNFESLQVVGIGVENDFAIVNLTADVEAFRDVVLTTLFGLKKLSCFEIMCEKLVFKIKFACKMDLISGLMADLKSVAKNIEICPNVCLLNLVGVGFCTHNEDVFKIIDVIKNANVNLKAVKLNEQVLTFIVPENHQQKALSSLSKALNLSNDKM